MAIMIFVGVLPMRGDSSGSAGADVKWTLDNNGNLKFSGSGEMRDFGRSLPYHPLLVKNVVVEDGITSLAANSFNGCSKLEVVELPSTLRTIGNNAFDGCKSLAIITIPYGVESIGREAFKGCKLLTELDIPGSVCAIDSKAFSDCSSLVIVRLPSTLKSLGADAFQKCKLIDVINELPAFVTASSAGFYKLNSRVVEKYWAKTDMAAAKQKHTAISVSQSLSADYATSRVGSTATPVTQDVFEPSEVDLMVPFTNRVNDKTYAVIISNENYLKMEKVPFALNDGEVFRQYCERTLGIPAANIFYHADATSGIMMEAIADLRTANRVAGGEMKVIFYYSGHGAPDEKTRDGYLVPVDASRINANVCLPLTSLYKQLSELDIESVTVFLDACFSGGERNGGTLLAANGERGVIIKPKKSRLSGNMVVFSATDSDQTALPYVDKGHGMFTYYLLKKLQDTKGNVSLAELDAYLRKMVNQSAFSINRREQTPTLSTSPGVSADWRNWRLNQ